MYKVFITLTALLINQAAFAETGKRSDPTSVANGKVLYQQYCQACHQKDGVGEKEIPGLLTRPGYLTAMPLNESSHAWHHTDDQIIDTILNGLKRTNRMPAWQGVITDQQANEVLAYLKSLWSDRVLACQGPRHMSCM